MSLINIGLESLNATQFAMSVVSKNIANANTPFYSRREANFSEAFYAMFGKGASASDAHRIFDEIINKNLQNTTSAFAKAAIFSENTLNLESLLNMDGFNIGDAINESLSSLNAANANPASIQTRDLYLSQLNNIISRFNNLNDQFNIEQTNINKALNADIEAINDITNRLALINSQVLSASSTELLELSDTQDELTATLANYIGISATTNPTGVLDIRLENGLPLLLGNKAYTLTTNYVAGDVSTLDIGIENNQGTVSIKNLIHNGEIAGLFNYQNNIFNPSKQSFDQLALGFAQSMNNQNRLGLDLQGNLGQDIIKFDINPKTGGAINLTMQLTDSKQLAFAFPVITESNPNNIGHGKIELTTITDTSTPSFSVAGTLTPRILIQFTSTTQYDVLNADDNSIIESGIPYDTANDAVVFPTPAGFDPGYRVTISTRDIAVGDAFSIHYNSQSVDGDNRNGLMLAALYQKNSLENNSLNFNQAYQFIGNRVSSQAKIASNTFESYDIMKKQAASRRDQISGVSLQEETTRLTQYQQSYQASAQIIDTAQKILETIIAIAGR